eukprot:1124434-Rhodomonas_salina.1
MGVQHSRDAPTARGEVLTYKGSLTFCTYTCWVLTYKGASPPGGGGVRECDPERVRARFVVGRVETVPEQPDDVYRRVGRFGKDDGSECVGPTRAPLWRLDVCARLGQEGSAWSASLWPGLRRFESRDACRVFAAHVAFSQQRPMEGFHSKTGHRIAWPG